MIQLLGLFKVQTIVEGSKTNFTKMVSSTHLITLLRLDQQSKQFFIVISFIVEKPAFFDECDIFKVKSIKRTV